MGNTLKEQFAETRCKDCDYTKENEFAVPCRYCSRFWKFEELDMHTKHGKGYEKYKDTIKKLRDA